MDHLPSDESDLTTPPLEDKSGPGAGASTAVNEARSRRELALKLTPSLLSTKAPASPTPITLPSGPCARSVIEPSTPLASAAHVLPSLLRRIWPFSPATSSEPA